MTKEKYAKYINKMFIEEEIPGSYHKEFEGKISMHAMIFDKSIYESAPFRIEYIFVHGSGTGYGLGTSFEKEIHGKKIRDLPMTHDCDEIFMFQGTNPQDQHELGGEIEYWLGEGKDAEKHIITEPTVVYVPAGLVHCPIYFRKVDRLIIMTVIFHATKWTTEYYPMPPAFKI